MTYIDRHIWQIFGFTFRQFLSKQICPIKGIHLNICKPVIAHIFHKINKKNTNGISNTIPVVLSLKALSLLQCKPFKYVLYHKYSNTTYQYCKITHFHTFQTKWTDDVIKKYSVYNTINHYSNDKTKRLCFVDSTLLFVICNDNFISLV